MGQKLFTVPQWGGNKTYLFAIIFGKHPWKPAFLRGEPLEGTRVLTHSHFILDLPILLYRLFLNSIPVITRSNYVMTLNHWLNFFLVMCPPGCNIDVENTPDFRLCQKHIGLLLTSHDHTTGCRTADAFEMRSAARVSGLRESYWKNHGKTTKKMGVNWRNLGLEWYLVMLSNVGSFIFAIETSQMFFLKGIKDWPCWKQLGKSILGGLI